MTELEARLHAFRQRFIEQALADAQSIASRTAAGEWLAVRDLSHGISGRAGMFGFHALSETASLLEYAIDDDLPPERLRRLVEAVLLDIRRLGGE